MPAMPLLKWFAHRAMQWLGAPLAVTLFVGSGLGLALTWPGSAAAQVTKPPVASPTAKLQAEQVLLTVVANDGKTHRFTEKDLLAMPQHRTSTHTAWTDGQQHFDGPLLRDILRKAGYPHPSSRWQIQATALNDFQVNIPLEDAWRWDVIVALRMNGQPIARRSKGPLWIVYPRDQHPELRESRYDTRWAWQLKQLTIHSATP